MIRVIFKRITAIAAIIAIISSYGCVNAEDYSANAGTIDLSKMSVTGEGIEVIDSTVRITKGGDFTVTGENENVMIYVNTEDRVKLRLSGMSIKNDTNPAFFFENVDKGFITLTENTENYISDGTEYSVDAKAAIFSNDDLEIKGKGVLNIEGNYKHAIASDDDLKIENGTVNILSAVSDGMHANGDIEVADGNITITAASDGIQAETNFIIDKGTINILKSEEGIESGGSMTINGGNINIVSTDDGLNSGGGLGGGTETMPEMGRPMGGAMPMGDMNRENPVPPELAGENAEMMTPPPMPKENIEMPRKNGEMPQMPQKEERPMPKPQNSANERSKETTEDVPSDTNIYINGGVITIDAMGDGIDANGNIIMTGGEVYVSGSEGGGDGAIDSYSFDVSGGTVLALGNKAMAVGVTQGSEQCAFNVSTDGIMKSGSLIEIKNADNEVILDYTLKKSANSVVFSSPELKLGETYTINCDGETLKEIEMTQTQVNNISGFGGIGGGMRNPKMQGGNQSDRIKITLNNAPLRLDTDPEIENDTTLVPLRGVLEALGAEVTWDEKTSTVIAKKDGTEIELQIGKKTARVNKKDTELLTAPKISGERTLVPIRFIAENLGLNVSWDEGSRTVIINE